MRLGLRSSKQRSLESNGIEFLEIVSLLLLGNNTPDAHTGRRQSGRMQGNMNQDNRTNVIGKRDPSLLLQLSDNEQAGKSKANGTRAPTQRRVDHTYSDYSNFPLEELPARKRAPTNFPSKLHQILSNPEYSHVSRQMQL